MTDSDDADEDEARHKINTLNGMSLWPDARVNVVVTADGQPVDVDTIMDAEV